MAPSQVWFEFVETTPFTRRIRDVGSPELLGAIQSELLENPTRWPVIRGRTARVRGRSPTPEGRGKSGSYRYLYLFLPHVDRIYLLFLFGKKEQDNVSLEQVRKIARWCDLIGEESS